MRRAGFDVEVGPPYFAFLREVLVFLVALADRIAYARLGAAGAGRVHRRAGASPGPHPAGQRGRPARAGAATARPRIGDSFIDLVNEVTGHYAEFGADPTLSDAGAGFHPDFAFVRYLGRRLEPALPEKDRRWVLDQVMAVEAPEAVAMVQRSLRDLFDPAAPRARRAGTTGE